MIFVYPPEIVRRAFTAIQGAGWRAAASAGLTPREREILVSFARGLSYSQIAKARLVRPVTIRNTIYGIQHKLGVDTMQGLVFWSMSNGLLDNWTRGTE